MALIRLMNGAAWILLAVRWATLGLFRAGVSVALSRAWLLWPAILLAE